MKSIEEIKSMLLTNLVELESTEYNDNQALQENLRTKLSILYDILGEDIPEEYWERIEDQL